jgi:hypothetical protein
MALAHTDMNFPPIPGLPPHPRQVEEQARIAEAQRNAEPSRTAATGGGDGRKSSSLMPEPAREVLKKLAQTMRRVGDVPEATPAGGTAPPAAAAPASPPAGAPDKPPARDRRAEAKSDGSRQ